MAARAAQTAARARITVLRTAGPAQLREARAAAGLPATGLAVVAQLLAPVRAMDRAAETRARLQALEAARPLAAVVEPAVAGV